MWPYSVVFVTMLCCIFNYALWHFDYDTWYWWLCCLAIFNILRGICERGAWYFLLLCVICDYTVWNLWLCCTIFETFLSGICWHNVQYLWLYWVIFVIMLRGICYYTCFHLWARCVVFLLNCVTFVTILCGICEHDV